MGGGFGGGGGGGGGRMGGDHMGGDRGMGGGGGGGGAMGGGGGGRGGDNFQQNFTQDTMGGAGNQGMMFGNQPTSTTQVSIPKDVSRGILLK